MRKIHIVLTLLAVLLYQLNAQEIVPAPIQTPWDSKVDVENVLPEYPRPQLVRTEWQNLNGYWQYAVTEAAVDAPSEWDGQILVPFCFESELSGVNRKIKPEEWMWYRRTIEIPAGWCEQRTWIHFEASDWETVLYVNGKEVGSHRGGYTPFSFDITDYLVEGKKQEIVVRVWDHLGQKMYVSAGKQGRTRDEAYEDSSGIWQTVWLEPRAECSINRLKVEGSYEKATVELSLDLSQKLPKNAVVEIDVMDDGKVVTSVMGRKLQFVIEVPDPKAWSPDNPYLYDLGIKIVHKGKVLDDVVSYVGLRDIAIDKSLHGPQITLNGKAMFHFGPLDQGYWPLTVFTPPTEEALLFELEYLKSIGCNMVRMHIKKNSDRWYYHCDRLGLMVWQDFICNKRFAEDQISREASEYWKEEQVKLMDSLNNHPSVVKWIVFNEAWGQHDTEAVVKWAEELLPHHIVSAASGWTDVYNLADIRDIHDYSRFPSITVPEREPNRAVVLGETGGFGVPVFGNNWEPLPNLKPVELPNGQIPEKDRRGRMRPIQTASDNDWVSDTKRPVYSVEGQIAHYERFIDVLKLEQHFGLSGAIYTQLTDMRQEQNGWLTFDRKVSKIPVDEMKRIHDKLYQRSPVRKQLVARGSEWETYKNKVEFPLSKEKSKESKHGFIKNGKKV
ncbi:MAG: hypothetical protein MI748_12440, partial [Opitutales bacterium]|nr:hypothetical protein [Opitutales bacterium]